MNKYSYAKFKKDLDLFIDCIMKIEDYEKYFEIRGLYSLANNFNKKKQINYELNDNPLIFNINSSISGTLPNTCCKTRIKLINSLFYENNNDCFFKTYEFLINIDSIVENETYKSSWRLDQEINSSEPRFTHPYFHLHYGSHYLEGLDTGMLSIYSSPRIPHPPMDIFLGFHFVLQNFFSRKDYPIIHRTFDASHAYCRIIREAQERLWTPYFKGLNPVDYSKHKHFNINKLFPLYLN